MFKYRIIFIVTLLTQLLIYLYFLNLQETNSNSVKNSIELLLRIDNLNNNPNQIARSLSDVENLGHIKCSKISGKTPETKFFLENYSENCSANPYLFLGSLKKLQFKGISGNIFNIEYIVINKRQFYVFFFSSQFLVLLIGFLTLILFNNTEQAHKKIIRLKENNIESIKRIVKQVDHDIKSPVGAIKIGITSFSKNPESSFKIIDKSVNRIEGILSDLKNSNNVLNKFESSLNLEEINLSSLVYDIVEEKKVDQPSITIIFDKPTQIVNVLADYFQTQRIVSNIINNSIEANARSIKIFFVGNNTLKIIDDGMGISKENLPQVTDYGFTYGKSNGSGTGLSHAHNTMIAMGGHLKISSSTGVEVELKFSSSSL